MWYWIQFAFRIFFTWQSIGENVKFFGVDMSSSEHIDYKNEILILHIGPTQGLDDTKLTAEAQYSIHFSRSNRKFWGCNLMGATVFYLLMLQKYMTYVKIFSLVCSVFIIQKVYRVMNKWGFYPSTFLQPVNGGKNSIINWVWKLNLLKSFLDVCLKKP